MILAKLAANTATIIIRIIPLSKAQASVDPVASIL